MDSSEISNIAHEYMYETARAIQFGGETLFLRKNGESVDVVDMEKSGYPGYVVLSLNGQDVKFAHESYTAHDEVVHFYLEVFPKKKVKKKGKKKARKKVAPPVVNAAQNFFRFSDGSTLTGPVMRLRKVGRHVVHVADYKASGGVATLWGKLWAEKSSGPDDDILSLCSRKNPRSGH